MIHVLLVLLTQSPEVFLDRGETYVRIGSAQGLSRGNTLDIVAAEGGKPLGTAVVMETWEGLARINLDTASTSFKGLKHARVRGKSPSGIEPDASLSVGAPPEKKPPAADSRRRALNGRVQLSGGLVDARRFIVYNLDNFDWHNCKIRLPDGRGYDRMDELRAQSDEGIMMFRFEPGLGLRDASGMVSVYCDEGSGRFVPQY
jgi:hypothetical protein